LLIIIIYSKLNIRKLTEACMSTLKSVIEEPENITFMERVNLEDFLI
jgi:hypothetical protein